MVYAEIEFDMDFGGLRRLIPASPIILFCEYAPYFLHTFDVMKRQAMAIIASIHKRLIKELINL